MKATRIDIRKGETTVIGRLRSLIRSPAIYTQLHRRVGDRASV
jgi:hypothetical protein